MAQKKQQLHKALKAVSTQYLSELLFVFGECVLTACKCRSGGTVCQMSVKRGDTKGLFGKCYFQMASPSLVVAAQGSHGHPQACSTLCTHYLCHQVD